jgi:hypothetical protein
MSGRLKKALLLTLAAALLGSVFFVQESLNGDRERLGLTRAEPLESAPPVLAFTTVALGGFRGLISNMLWIRAGDLQDKDKFFELAQLADWITKLEPHYVQVWLVQAWNMAYNISVKFTDFGDRWRWVQRGIELLRDEGLPANPNEVLIYRELAWFFQHKMGANLDDGHAYYKQQWIHQMGQVFGKLRTPDLDELINPQTDDQKARARLLREKYKMDPVFMKEVDQRYGPLEWRLPEGHAIYWAALGLRVAGENPSKVTEKDLITLRRVIYQSMQLSFQRGRLVLNPFVQGFEFGPNLDIIPKVSKAYEQAAEEDAEYRDHIRSAHRNFLKDAIYFLYAYNRMAEASYWYNYMAREYPNGDVLDTRNSPASKVTLERYCISRIQEDADGTPRDRIKNTIEGLLARSYDSLAIGEDDHATGYKLLAMKLRENYMRRLSDQRTPAVGLPPMADIDREILGRILDSQHGWPPQVRAVLRTKLRLPAETVPIPTPAPATTTTTNAPPVE